MLSLPSGWDGLKHYVSHSAHEVSGARNMSDPSSTRFSRHSDTTCGSMIRAMFWPSYWIDILLLH